MRFRVLCLLTAVVCLGVLVGCAESKAYQGYRDELSDWSYGKRFVTVWKDWALDFVDMGSMELSAGECIGAEVQPTELGQVGFFFGNVMKLGCRDRSFGFYNERRKEGGISWFYYRYVDMEPIQGTPSLFDEEYRPRMVDGFPIRDNKEWHWADVGAEVGLIFFGASAHFSPKQTLDFAVSTVALPFELVGRPILSAMGLRLPEIDFCDDDTAARIRRRHDVKLIEQPEGLPPVEYFNERMRQAY